MGFNINLNLNYESANLDKLYNDPNKYGGVSLKNSTSTSGVGGVSGPSTYSQVNQTEIMDLSTSTSTGKSASLSSGSPFSGGNQTSSGSPTGGVTPGSQNPDASFMPDGSSDKSGIPFGKDSSTTQAPQMSQDGTKAFGENSPGTTSTQTNTGGSSTTINSHGNSGSMGGFSQGSNPMNQSSPMNQGSSTQGGLGGSSMGQGNSTQSGLDNSPLGMGNSNQGGLGAGAVSLDMPAEGVQVASTDISVTDGKVVMTSVDISGQVYETEIDSENYISTLKTYGLNDIDINRVMSGGITLEGLLEEIQNDTNNSRREDMLASSYLQSFGVEATTLTELDGIIRSLEADLKVLQEERSLADKDEYRAIMSIIQRLRFGEKLDDVLATETVAWSYIDENGNTAYLYVDPLIGGTAGVEYTALKYEDIFPDSKLLDELKKLTNNGWEESKEQSAFYDEMVSKFDSKTTDTSLIDEKIAELEVEIEKNKYIEEYINGELNHYMNHIDKYMINDDFLGNIDFNKDSLSVIDYLEEKYHLDIENGPYMSQTISISGKENIVNLISCVFNGQVDSLRFLNSDSTHFHVISTDDIFEHYTEWADLVSNDEKAVFNYILNKEGVDAAYKYLEDISEELDSRWLIQKTQEDQDYAREHPVLASIGSIVVTPIEGMSAACYSLNSYLTHQKIMRTDVYSAGDIWRGTVAEQIAKEHGEGWSFVYSTGMSMADSIALIGLTAATGGGSAVASFTISATTMGSRAYVSTLNDALDRGLSDGQAVGLAFSSAVVETAMEHFSAGHLLNLEGTLSKETIQLAGKIASKVENKAMANLVTKGFYVCASAISQGVAEGEEEFATEILNYIADIAIAGDLSNYVQSLENYKSQGMSDDEALLATFKDFGGQAFQAFLGGFASGVCFGTFGGVKSTINTSHGIAQQMYSDLYGTTKAQQFASALEINQTQLKNLEEAAGKVKHGGELTSEEQMLLQNGTTEGQAGADLRHNLGNKVKGLFSTSKSATGTEISGFSAGEVDLIKSGIKGRNLEDLVVFKDGSVIIKDNITAEEKTKVLNVVTTAVTMNINELLDLYPSHLDAWNSLGREEANIESSLEGLVENGNFEAANTKLMTLLENRLKFLETLKAGEVQKVDATNLEEALENTMEMPVIQPTQTLDAEVDNRTETTTVGNPLAGLSIEEISQYINSHPDDMDTLFNTPEVQTICIDDLDINVTYATLKIINNLSESSVTPELISRVVSLDDAGFNEFLKWNLNDQFFRDTAFRDRVIENGFVSIGRRAPDIQLEFIKNDAFLNSIDTSNATGLSFITALEPSNMQLLLERLNIADKNSQFLYDLIKFRLDLENFSFKHLFEGIKIFDNSDFIDNEQYAMVFSQIKDSAYLSELFQNDLLDKIRFFDKSAQFRMDFVQNMAENINPEYIRNLIESSKILEDLSLIKDSNLAGILSSIKDMDYLYELLSDEAIFNKIQESKREDYNIYGLIKLLDTEHQIKLLKELEGKDFFKRIRKQDLNTFMCNLTPESIRLILDNHAEFISFLTNKTKLIIFSKTQDESFIQEIKEGLDNGTLQLETYESNVIVENNLYDAFNTDQIVKAFNNFGASDLNDILAKMPEGENKAALSNHLDSKINDITSWTFYKFLTLIDRLSDQKKTEILSTLDLSYSELRQIKDKISSTQFETVKDRMPVEEFISNCKYDNDLFNYTIKRLKEDPGALNDASLSLISTADDVPQLLELASVVEDKGKLNFVTKDTLNDSKFRETVKNIILKEPSLITSCNSFNYSSILECFDLEQRIKLYDYIKSKDLMDLFSDTMSNQEKSAILSHLASDFNNTHHYDIEHFAAKISAEDQMEWLSQVSDFKINDSLFSVIKAAKNDEVVKTIFGKVFSIENLNKISSDKKSLDSLNDFILSLDNKAFNVFFETSNDGLLLACYSLVKTPILESEIMRRFETKKSIFNFTLNESMIESLSQESKQIIDQYVNQELAQIDIPNLESLLDGGKLTYKYNFLMAYQKGLINAEKVELLLKLKERNKFVLGSFNYKLFEGDIYALGDEFTQKLSKYPGMVDQVSRLRQSKERFNLFGKLVTSDTEASLVVSNYKMAQILNYLSDSSKEIDVNILNCQTEEDIEVAREIILRDIDHFTVVDKNTGDFFVRDRSLINIPVCPMSEYYENLRKECDDLFSKATTVQEVQNIFFNKYFSMSLEDAEEMFRIYGSKFDGIRKFDDTGIAMAYLENIYNILSITDMKEAASYYNSFNNYYTMSENLAVINEIKKCYTRSLKDVLYSAPTGEPSRYVTYNGQQIPVYEATGDFKMLIQSTETNYGGMPIINNSYYESWNSSERTSNHGICCSMISSDNMGMALVQGDGIVIGFNSFSDEQVNMMSPYDLYTFNDGFVINCGRPLTYLPGSEVSNYTRHTHNEFNLERTDLTGTSTLPNIQPDYVVIFDEMSEQLKNNAYKASLEFNIPLIYVNKSTLAAEQSVKIDSLISEFKSTGNVEILEQILLKHENNRSGYRNDTDKVLNEKYFTSARIQNVLFEGINSAKSIEDLNYIKEFLEIEKQKYDSTFEMTGRTNEIDIDLEGMLKAIDERIDNFNGKTEVSVSESYTDSVAVKGLHDAITGSIGNESAFNKFDIANLSPELRTQQYDSEAVSEMLQDETLKAKLDKIIAGIEREGINSGLKVHGPRHINDVSLYTLLVGKEVLNEADLDLALLSAKFHDSGRTTEGTEEHAKSSAVFARKALNGTLSESDLGIVVTAIEFHEVQRGLSNIDEIFKNMALANGVLPSELDRARVIAEVIKDADALDRTRFVNGARLNAKFLKYDESKRYVKFSALLQETYAIEDLKALNVPDDVEKLTKYYAPQEIIRSYRKYGRHQSPHDFFSKMLADIEGTKLNAPKVDNLNNTLEFNLPFGKKANKNQFVEDIKARNIVSSRLTKEQQRFVDDINNTIKKHGSASVVLNSTDQITVAMLNKISDLSNFKVQLLDGLGDGHYHLKNKYIASKYVNRVTYTGYEMMSIIKSLDNMVSKIDMNLNPYDRAKQAYKVLASEIPVFRDYKNYGDGGHVVAASLRGLTPYNFTGRNGLVCAGYASAYHELCKRIGVDCEYVRGVGYKDAIRSGKPGAHAWNVIKVDGKVIPVDICWAACSELSENWFGASEEFAGRHVADSDEVYNDYMPHVEQNNKVYYDKNSYEFSVNPDTINVSDLSLQCYALYNAYDACQRYYGDGKERLKAFLETGNVNKITRQNNARGKIEEFMPGYLNDCVEHINHTINDAINETSKKYGEGAGLIAFQKFLNDGNFKHITSTNGAREGLMGLSVSSYRAFVLSGLWEANS